MDVARDVNLVLRTRSGLFAHAKQTFTSHELRLKQSVWDWLRSQSPAELERVRMPQARTTRG